MKRYILSSAISEISSIGSIVPKGKHGAEATIAMVFLLIASFISSIFASKFSFKFTYLIFMLK